MIQLFEKLKKKYVTAYNAKATILACILAIMLFVTYVNGALWRAIKFYNDLGF